MFWPWNIKIYLHVFWIPILIFNVIFFTTFWNHMLEHWTNACRINFHFAFACIFEPLKMSNYYMPMWISQNMLCIYTLADPRECLAIRSPDAPMFHLINWNLQLSSCWKLSGPALDAFSWAGSLRTMNAAPRTIYTCSCVVRLQSF